MGSIPGSGRYPGGGHAIHASILAWRIPWTEEPGGLQFMGSQRVGHSWATEHINPALYLQLTPEVRLESALPPLIKNHPTSHLGSISKNSYNLLPLCGHIETLPSIKITPWVSLPQSGSSDAEGTTLVPPCGVLCPVIQQVIICIFLIHQLQAPQYKALIDKVREKTNKEKQTRLRKL